MDGKRLRYGLWIATFLNPSIALWLLLAGMFTFETWPSIAGLALGAALLVFTGSAWGFYARSQHADAEQRLRLTLWLDVLALGLILFWAWRYPGFRDWR